MNTALLGWDVHVRPTESLRPVQRTSPQHNVKGRQLSFTIAVNSLWSVFMSVEYAH